MSSSSMLTMVSSSCSCLGGGGGGGGLPVVVMLFLNMVAAIMVSLVKVAMDGGMDPLVIVTLQQLTASIFLAPIAFFKERFSINFFLKKILHATSSSISMSSIFIGLIYGESK